MKHNEIDWDTLEFRCHSLGYIMAEPKEKSNKEKYNELMFKYKEKNEALAKCSDKAVKTSEKLVDEMEWISKRLDELKPRLHIEELSESCKTHLADLYTAIVYNRREEIKSKYLKKGLKLEEDAITLYCQVYGGFHKKNTVRKHNGWINGECDIETPDFIVDTKVNWSIFQFNRVKSKPILPLYDWQGEGYMWLWEKPEFKLAYCLLNTPPHMIALEKKKLFYDFIGTEEDYKEACDELERNHTYDDIPPEERIRVFKTYSSEERKEKIKSRIIQCRNYLKNFNNENQN